MIKLLVGSLATVAIILTPLTTLAYGHHHSNNPVIVTPSKVIVIPPPVVVLPPVTSSFTLGAFNSTVGTVDVYFVDITDLSGLKPCESQTQFIYLENNTTSNASISNGSVDKALSNFASRACPGSIIAFGHEFNLTENPWGGNPSTFIAAYQHVHNVIGTGFKYAWVANNSDTSGTPGVLSYWPGSSYVDIIGEDAFQWSSSETFTQAIQPNYSILKAEASSQNKPLWITSTGTQWNQSSWISNALTVAKSDGFSGFLYFDYNDGGNFALPQSIVNLL